MGGRRWQRGCGASRTHNKRKRGKKTLLLISSAAGFPAVKRIYKLRLDHLTYLTLTVRNGGLLPCGVFHEAGTTAVSL